MRPDDAAIMTVRLEAALHEIDMRVAAIPQNVGRIRSATRRFIDSLEVDEEVAHAILLATGEAVANAVEHAYAGEAEPGDVLVRVRADGEQAEVVIEDFGRWARGESDPERGRGLGLMRELASVASIEKASSGTIVRLDFALAPRATPLPSRAVTTPR
jgi:anti-sigma regulatory factor (Ser/Thr protein kinase)